MNEVTLVLCIFGSLMILVGPIVLLTMFFCWKKCQKLVGINPDNDTFWHWFNNPSTKVRGTNIFGRRR